MLSLYQWLQPLLLATLRFLGRRSEKFAELLRVREGLLGRWAHAAPSFGENRIWIHVSSVGELEQARPVIEYLSARGHSVVLS